MSGYQIAEALPPKVCSCTGLYYISPPSSGSNKQVRKSLGRGQLSLAASNPSDFLETLCSVTHLLHKSLNTLFKKVTKGLII